MAIARLIADENELKTRLQMPRTAMVERGIAMAEAETGPSPAVLTLSHGDAEQLRGALDHMFPDCDWVVTHGDIGAPKVFISDMDSTMIGQECIDELADYAGIKRQISAITERAMLGELDFDSALRERVALLAGLEESAIDRCLEERIRPNPGARELVEGLKARGTRTVLVTGGFRQFADRVAETIGFDRVVAEEMAGLGEGAVSLALGDGANDIPMIEAATCGIAYRAKPRAKAAADGRVESGNLANVLALLPL